MLGRSRRSVLVVDVGAPRNLRAEGVHGLLGHDGIPPAELIERGRNEVSRYGGEVVTAEVVGTALVTTGLMVVPPPVGWRQRLRRLRGSGPKSLLGRRHLAPRLRRLRLQVWRSVRGHDCLCSSALAHLGWG